MQADPGASPVLGRAASNVRLSGFCNRDSVTAIIGLGAVSPRRSQVQLQIGYEERQNGIAVITVAGRLMQGPEGERIEAIVRELLANGVRKIILDFSGLTHIDSTGIGRTIAALNLVMQHGANMVVAGAKGSVREAFRVTQLDRVFRFYDDLPAAEAALGS